MDSIDTTKHKQAIDEACVALGNTINLLQQKKVYPDRVADFIIAQSIKLGKIPGVEAATVKLLETVTGDKA